MQRKLFDAYCEALSAAPSEDDVVPAAVISGRESDFVAVGAEEQPMILLSCAGLAGLRRPPIMLQHLTVEFGIHYRIRTPHSFDDGHFVVMSLRGEDQALIELFCLAADALLDALPEAPSVGDVERVVRQFVELMSALSVPSPRTVVGLWAELWLMSVATNPLAAVAAWHGMNTDRFDFAFAEHFVEVKATEWGERNHEFSYEQLRGSQLPVSVASLKLRRAQNGKSISDLVSELQEVLNPEMRTKLVRNVFGAVGSAVSEASEMRFDEAFAETNLRLIAADRVPTVVIPEGSPISSVRFRVNLDDSSMTDDLLAPDSRVALEPQTLHQD